MFAFILRRLLQSVLVMLTVALVSFGLFRYIGDPVNNMVGQEATMAEREALRESLGTAWSRLKGLPRSALK